MSLISVHRKARLDKTRIIFHEFKLRYKKNSSTIYGFVEGEEDISYYRGFIENSTPEGWNVDLWSSGGRDQVLDIYSKLDWRRFNKKNILFFVDRDLTELLSIHTPADVNIYITDEYSIENAMVNRPTCNRVLRELCGITHVNHGDFDAILDLFESELQKFKKELSPIMSCIINWQKTSAKACLEDIQMKHIFFIKNGCLINKSAPKRCKDIYEYSHTQCNISAYDAPKLSKITTDFVDNNHQSKFCRGKYLLWFLVEFSLSIYKEFKTIGFLSKYKKPKMKSNLSHSNSIVQIAPRCRPPVSLRTFFSNNIDIYVK